MGCEWFGLKTTWTVFAGLISKPVVTVFPGLASKQVVTISSGLASKPVVMIFTGLASKPVVAVFSSLASKLVTTVSSDLASKPVISFLDEPQNRGGEGFPGVGLKTDSFGLVIWASKSLRQFFGLGLKTKQTLVYRLLYKTDGRRSARDTRRDLAACLAWKQVWLVFSSLA
jgi:hypothetical protein